MSKLVRNSDEAHAKLIRLALETQAEPCARLPLGEFLTQLLMDYVSEYEFERAVRKHVNEFTSKQVNEISSLPQTPSLKFLNSPELNPQEIQEIKREELTPSVSPPDKKPKKKDFAPADIESATERLVEAYRAKHSEREVRDRIEEALDHQAASKRSSAFLYLRNWLRKDFGEAEQTGESVLDRYAREQRERRESGGMT